MKRTLSKRELVNTRLANEYGGWIYCTNCNINIGYLCYVTYDQFYLNYECHCGSKGGLKLEFEDQSNSCKNELELMMIKNRNCCPQDESPLFTILSKNIKSYKAEVVCNHCKNKYIKENEK